MVSQVANVSFRKRATQYRSLLRKMTYQDKAPCTNALMVSQMAHVVIIHGICRADFENICVCPIISQMANANALMVSQMANVSFCKRATKYRSLLRKMTYQDKASYVCLPLCTNALMISKKAKEPLDLGLFC